MTHEGKIAQDQLLALSLNADLFVYLGGHGYFLNWQNYLSSSILGIFPLLSSLLLAGERIPADPWHVG